MSDSKASQGVVEADARNGRTRHVGRCQGFSPYPKYKPSGVEWLGDVPEHWDIRRLRHVCRLAYGDSLAFRDRDSGGSVLVYGSNGKVGVHSSANVCGPCLIIGRKGSYGKVSYSRLPIFAIDTTYYVDRRHTDADIRWLYYMLTSMQLDSLSKDSAIPGLNRQDAYARICLWPPLREQRTIAAHLDRETAKIDVLIGRNEVLIERLKEQRAALISRTLTRGLPPDESRKAGIDPHPKLKSSGVEWLGDVPERWRVGRLKEYGDVISGSAFPIRLQGSTEGALSFYKVSDLTEICSDGQHMDEARNRISYQVAHDLRARIIPKRAIVYAKIGAACLLNRRRITTVKCCIDNNMTAYIPNRLVTHKWAYYWMTSLDFAAVANPGAIPSVSEGYQKTLPIVVPPTLEEQEALTGFLDRQTATVDEATTLACREIDLLREYRTRLISDVVTGRVDIRCVAGAGVEAE